MPAVSRQPKAGETASKAVEMKVVNFMMMMMMMEGRAENVCFVIQDLNES